MCHIYGAIEKSGRRAAQIYAKRSPTNSNVSIKCLHVFLNNLKSMELSLVHIHHIVECETPNRQAIYRVRILGCSSTYYKIASYIRTVRASSIISGTGNLLVSLRCWWKRAFYLILRFAPVGVAFCIHLSNSPTVFLLSYRNLNTHLHVHLICNN